VTDVVFVGSKGFESAIARAFDSHRDEPVPGSHGILECADALVLFAPPLADHVKGFSFSR
jgi:hypothetical protein